MPCREDAGAIHDVRTGGFAKAPVGAAGITHRRETAHQDAAQNRNRPQGRQRVGQVGV